MFRQLPVVSMECMEAGQPRTMKFVACCSDHEPEAASGRGEGVDLRTSPRRGFELDRELAACEGHVEGARKLRLKDNRGSDEGRQADVTLGICSPLCWLIGRACGDVTDMCRLSGIRKNK